MSYTTLIRVRFRDLDPYAHVNHAVYVTWFEIARTDALRHHGISLAGPRAGELQFVVASLEVRYIRAAVADDLVRVEAAITELRGASSRWRHRVWRDEELLVDGTVRIGLVGAGGRPARMSDQLRRALAPLVDGGPPGTRLGTVAPVRAARRRRVHAVAI